MNTTLQMLGLCSLGLGVALGCGEYHAPTGPGCGEDQQSNVVLEGDLRLTRVYINREYTTVLIVSSQAKTIHHRTCQSYTCWEAREDPAAPLGEAEAAEALARCTAMADAEWAATGPYISAHPPAHAPDSSPPAPAAPSRRRSSPGPRPSPAPAYP